ncbi:amidohydrolase/deacetylase family metallohydrolase [Ruegeria sp.]|uniref:amidohydrolase/deacetylase family metallohydrolase n=1 Tax=Ruegeria sp. TaxID=1879320 RepID=UPI00230B9D71|nr:amidohydrolase/deacetylase family metallohydrolase [Ruegeria sp.]MDA7963644.1 amidohydrolase/deacetylase family metallohydrolase [Ruegeria sp.]
MTKELLIRASRVIDPSQDWDGPAEILLQNGKVTGFGPSLSTSAAVPVLNADQGIVVPGLIDFHSHVWWGGTSLSVKPEPVARRSGTTTFLDTGSAGAGTMAGFHAHIAQQTDLTILAYINVSFAGIFGFSESVMIGECADIRLLDARECVRVAKQFPDFVRGVKVRVGQKAGGDQGIAPLEVALDIADQLGLPVMSHIDFPPPGGRQILDLLRPGDILTHFLRPFPNSAVDSQGAVKAEYWKARERGVLFDVGHGYGGFGFEAGEAALDHGFPPDIISSDVHVLCENGPAFDVLSVMNKFWSMGMELPDVIRAATATPAAILRRPDLGTLAPCARADVAILDIREDATEFVDAIGVRRSVDRYLSCSEMVVGGHVWPTSGG